jgi:oligopeptide transport system substrate-binding protein
MPPGPTGKTVKAGDFVSLFQRYSLPGLVQNSIHALLYENAEKYHKGVLKDFTRVGARAADDTTLIIRLGSSTPYFMSLIMHDSWFPVHPATILKFGNIDSRGTRWTRPDNFVGNGAFRLADWQINKIIGVVKRADYWDAQNVKLNGINFYTDRNNQTEERCSVTMSFM